MALTADEQALLSSLEQVDAGIAPTSPPSLEELRAAGLARKDAIALTDKGKAVLADLRMRAAQPNQDAVSHVDPSADPDADAGADPDADAGADPDADAGADPDTDAGADAGADPDVDPDADPEDPANGTDPSPDVGGYRLTRPGRGRP